MKKFLSILLQLILLVVVFAPMSAAETIAVLDFKSLMTDDELGVAVAEILKTELAGQGQYTIIERGMLEQILEEQALQLSGAVDTDTAVKIGKLVGANIVVTGSIVKTGDMFTINSRFIEVETGIVQVGKNIRGQGESQISNMVQQLALMISGTAVVTEEPSPTAETADVSAPASTIDTPNAPKTKKDTHDDSAAPPSPPDAAEPPRRDDMRQGLFDACQGKDELDACQLGRGESKQFKTTCRSVEGQLACLLSREDAPKKMQARWDEMDKNHDGLLEPSEFLGRPPRQQPPDGKNPPARKK